jgi:hypothetical protein
MADQAETAQHTTEERVIGGCWIIFEPVDSPLL